MSEQRNDEAPCPCGCPPEMHIGEIGCPCALPGEGACRTEYDRGYDVGYHDREQDCGAVCPERIAKLAADVAHWKAHAEEAGDGFTRVCREYARVAARNTALIREIERLGGAAPTYSAQDQP